MAVIISNIRLSNAKDKVKWRHNNDTFRVKDLYQLLEPNNIRERPWQQIWRIKVPTRVKLFLWKLSNPVLPVRTRLS